MNSHKEAIEQQMARLKKKELLGTLIQREFCSFQNSNPKTCTFSFFFQNPTIEAAENANFVVWLLLFCILNDTTLRNVF